MRSIVRLRVHNLVFIALSLIPGVADAGSVEIGSSKYYVLMVAGTVFVIATLGWLVTRLVSGFAMLWRVKEWKAAAARVDRIESKDSLFSSEAKNAYVHYSYEVGGSTYSNDVYSPFSKLYDYETHRGFPVPGMVTYFCTYREGATVDVFYDSAHPARSCLTNKVSKRDVVGKLFMVVFLSLVLVGVFYLS